ncbi:glycosyltransferase family 39 protein [Mucilaginibacter sp. Bleaf8]|uniref:ArnT family glycosyltransferase n=1 Tax=Mucilaginibacter sp. Bleaf8 TaxID=2834430 RepID=UPI001BCB5F59|nr:glycosyltransferase family 39 protein [Mucilaginibacter sp. Bleaf8]MBS7564168.1 glycosyltransferase family 39 protein [Mucilaginibacter sp. Bleaf8]
MFESVTSHRPAKSSGKLIYLFLFGWTVFNILQAATLGVHSDEAYYWIYSRFLDWGYYDHPPMVALFIRIGDSVLHSELGLRLMTILTSTISMYVLWLIAQKYKADARWFVLLVTGTLAFNIYGFTTTPDAPLLFFAVLFYYLYQQYLERDSWTIALLLALVVACLLYSKYHAVLLILFTILSNLKLFKRATFWGIMLMAVALYLPHIWWQVSHNYPSINYHLFERSSETYQFEHTYLYIPGQLMMAGPLVGWFLFYYAYGRKVQDVFSRALLFNGIGILVFFLLNTIKGNVQPHWTLISFISLVLLTLIHLHQSGKQPAWLYRLVLINALLVVVFRLVLLAQWAPLLKRHPFRSYFGYPEWTREIQQKAGNAPVVFDYGFQEPSKYNFYSHSLKAFAYDASNYRRTQYDIWPLEDSLQHKRVYYVSQGIVQGVSTDTLHTVKGIYYGGWVNDVRTYQKVDVQILERKLVVKPHQLVTFKLKITNPYRIPVNFNNEGQIHAADLTARFFQGDEMPYAQQAGADFNRLTIPAGQSRMYTFTLRAPDNKGRYDLIFSIRTTPFPGGRNSRMINFTVQ